MPERAINTKSATGCLLVLIPAALTMSALFVAWPAILGVTLLLAGGNIWQSYAWSKTSQSIDPFFQQSIVQYRGEITPLDLSIKANISGAVAKRYLATKASEFGTGSRQHPDRGQVYYFVSISTLGSIFDDSELELPGITPATTPVVAFQSIPTPIASPTEVSLQSGLDPSVATSTTANLPTASTEGTLQPESTPPVATVATSSLSIAPDATPQETTPDLHNLRQLFDEEPAPATIVDRPEVEQIPIADPTTAPPTNSPIVTIIQSELAKRLDVHSSTVYKRRSEPNFTDWTRNRDPEGIAWGYAEATKEYYRIET
jgi:hypothetical protein